jgi:hypothetical protein
MTTEEGLVRDERVRFDNDRGARKKKKDERCVERGSGKYPMANTSFLEAANKKQNDVK